MGPDAENDRALLTRYVLAHLGDVLKEPRSFIRFPFIDPGSVYDGNVWDWDTYWSVRGLFGLSRLLTPEENARVLLHAQGNVRNFLDHQLPDGYIPMMIEVADWPEPYLNMRRREGVMMNMHKPFLCGQILAICRHSGDTSWISGFGGALEKYFACYDRDYFDPHCGLYVWKDDIMIGMDNDPASFGRPQSSTANIFLNAFMAEELRCMAELCASLGLAGRAAYYAGKRDALIACIRSECWDPRDRFYYSVDVDIRTRAYDWFHKGLGVFWKTLPIRIRAWSGFIPMWAGFATADEARELVRQMTDEGLFACPYGITTLAKNETMFDISATNNPSNWLGPVWLVANYVAFSGLLRYGYRAEAEQVCRQSLKLLGEDLRASGSLHEYYDPFTGRPVMNGGFINWNILALNMAGELEEG